MATEEPSLAEMSLEEVSRRLEPQYSVVRPDDLGTSWNIRLQTTPVVPNPFGRS